VRLCDQSPWPSNGFGHGNFGDLKIRPLLVEQDGVSIPLALAFANKSPY
jgi:hypothetical protein